VEAVVGGIGLQGPGLQGWTESLPVLRGELPYVARPFVVPAPDLLSERERRRSSAVIRLALDVAGQAAETAPVPVADLPVVFGSSLGDGAVLKQLLEALSTAGALVSPTSFHNSVHNAPSGYWSIGHRSRQPCTSIAAHDWTFAAVLMKAMMQVEVERRPVLMAAFDLPLPPPLDPLRPVTLAFAAALLLLPAGAAGGRRIRMAWRPGAAVQTPVEDGPLQGLVACNPAARALPLLRRLALDDAAELTIAYPEDGHLAIAVAAA
jgi:hypothetical protein